MYKVRPPHYAYPRWSIVDALYMTHYAVVTRDWQGFTADGLPAVDCERCYFYIEHYQRFYELLEKELASPVAKEFEKGALMYLEYARQRQATPPTSIEPLDAAEAKSLNWLISYRIFGPQMWDPMIRLALQVELAKVQEMVINIKNVGELRKITVIDAEIRSAMQKMIQSNEEFNTYTKNLATKTLLETGPVNRVAKTFPILKELTNWLLGERKWDDLKSASYSASTDPMVQSYYRFLERNNNPIFVSTSMNKIHGTHVSGIVAKQHEDIRILPIRVTSETMDLSRARSAREEATYRKDFLAWLQEPVVFRAVGKFLQNAELELSFVDESPANREHVAKELMRLFDEFIGIEFQGNKLNYLFIKELREAIRYTGEQKIKVANMSLGVSFENAPSPIPSSESADDLPKFYEFLKYEFYKYRIGEQVQRYAAKTLFVVALGNDGKWVDGKTRSALPVDISSPFLEAGENRKAGEIAPNNQIDNILAVGSLNSSLEFSSYTNLLLGRRTPYVLAQGEGILSPIRMLNGQGTTELVTHLYPEINLFSPISTNDKRVKDFFKARTKDHTDVGLERAVDLFDFYYDLSVEAKRVIMFHLYMKYPARRARLSGTSMASPAVAGVVAGMAIEKAKKARISMGEVYDRPEFAPKILINDLMRSSQKIAGTNLAIPFNQLPVQHHYDYDEDTQKLETFLRGIISPYRKLRPQKPLLGPLSKP